MSLMVDGERQRWNSRAVAVERQHVVAPRRAVAEHEDLSWPFGAQVDEVVARAAEEAGEIEIARLERDLAVRRAARSSVQLTLYVLLKKRAICRCREAR